MKSYMNKAELSRCFGISPATVYRRVAGIEEEIKKGRYNRYAIADGLISAAVFADYAKYHKRLNDRNLRRTVPAFSMDEAKEYLLKTERKEPTVTGYGAQNMVKDYIKLREKEEQSWQEYEYKFKKKMPHEALEEARKAYEEIKNQYIGLALAIANRAAESLNQEAGRSRRAGLWKEGGRDAVHN